MARRRPRVTAALECAERLLRCVATEAVPLLKAGGVGSREVKRLVRAGGLAEEAIRFWLYVVENAGLVVCQNGRLLATPEYDQWITDEPSRRYAVLFGAWMALPTSVLGPFALTRCRGEAACGVVRLCVRRCGALCSDALSWN